MNDGEIRQGQVLTTFGPGSMIDLPTHSVMVGGLELWTYPRKGGRRAISEPRLQQQIARERGVVEVRLYAPPTDAEEESPSTGIKVIRFPKWFLAQKESPFIDPNGREYRSRPLVHWKDLVDGQFQDDTRKRYKVVPVRFVQVCPRGHIDDVNWRWFLTRGVGGIAPGEPLFLDEAGAGNDFAEIFVRHPRTGMRRRIADGDIQIGGLGRCLGRRPWLGGDNREACTEIARILNRSASNAWFPMNLSVISLPELGEKLRKSVDVVWDNYLREGCESVDDVTSERRKRAAVRSALEGFTDQAVWEEIERRRSGAPTTGKSIKDAELETLLAQTETEAEDPTSDFFARRCPLSELPPILQGRVERIVLVHRLREVVAQLGFTRLEAPQTDINGDLSAGVTRAPLAAQEDWLPALENRGEGIFLGFRREAIEQWAVRAAPRAQQLYLAFGDWCRGAGLDPTKLEYPKLPYVMLHSLAHMLLVQVALECGYSTSAIRERVYASPSLGYGILLYTAGSGSEGTLGGLVEAGRSIGRHLEAALERARLCSNDPVCSHHDPNGDVQERMLHGAACHGCLFVPETSCERRNEHLDRALVVRALGVEDIAFFPEAG